MSLQQQIDDINRRLNDVVAPNDLTDFATPPIGAQAVAVDPATNIFVKVPLTEGNGYKGTFTNLAALQLAFPSPNEGDFAFSTDLRTRWDYILGIWSAQPRAVIYEEKELYATLADMIAAQPTHEIGDVLYVVDATADPDVVTRGTTDAYYTYTNSGSEVYLLLPAAVESQTPTIAKSLRFNFISKSEVVDPILSPDLNGWDENLGEAGNMIKVGNTYIISYTGFQTPYSQIASYVGFATSTDGINFIKQGVDGKSTILEANEDPYIVYVDGTYYLYTEYKEIFPFEGIRLYTSTDLLNWTDRGYVLQPSQSWELLDVSSPTVIYENGVFTMYYEGRLSSGQSGAVGIATSTDGINFTKNINNPIISGQQLDGQFKWCSHLVPDDVFKIDSVYYMTLHCFDGSTFSGGLATSIDGINWNDALEGNFSGYWGDNFGFGLMVFKNDKEIFPIYLDLSLNDSNEFKMYRGAFSVATKQQLGKSKKTIGGTSYTLIPSDISKHLIFTQACTVTVPTGLTIDSVFEGECSNGKVTFVNAVGVTINVFADFLKNTAGSFAVFGLRITASNVATLYGTLELS